MHIVLRLPRARHLGGWLLLGGLAGCGMLEPAGPSERADAPLSDGSAHPVGTAELTCREEAPRDPVARRLTRWEYVNTIRDTLGIDIGPDARALLPDDPKVGGFSNTAQALAVSTLHVEGYWSLAPRVVDAVADWEGFVAAHAPCTEPAEDACARGFVAGVGELLYRRPLQVEEVDGLLPIFGAAPSFAEGARRATQALLMSPQFLYRLEPSVVGPPTDDARPLDAHELASRLSYTLWASSPDRTLRDAAATGALLDEAVFAEQVARMLEDPRARRATQQYFEEWLNLSELEGMVRDRARYPEFDEALAAEMKRETLDLIDTVLWDERRPLMDLLVAEWTVVSGDLARLYGLEPRSEGLAAYDLTGHPDRYGVFTHASTLASTAHGDEASLVERGVFMFEHLLCGTVEQPPPGVETTRPKLSEGAGQRAFSEARMATPTCAGCHQQVDPLGYTLERYDGIGRANDADPWGNPLVGNGELAQPDGSILTFANIREFMDQMRDNDRVRSCMTRHHLQFALGRPVSARSCELARVSAQFTELRSRSARCALRQQAGSACEFPEDPTIRQMLTAIVLDPAFRTVPARGGAL